MVEREVREEGRETERDRELWRHTLCLSGWAAPAGVRHCPAIQNRGRPARWTYLCLARARCARKADWMTVTASSCHGSPSAWTTGLGTRGSGESWGSDVGKRTA